MKALWYFHLSQNPTSELYDVSISLWTTDAKGYTDPSPKKICIYGKMSYMINKRSLVLKVVSFVRTILGISPLLLHVLHTYAMDTFISPISYLPRIWDTKKWRKVTFFHEKDLLGFQIYQQMEHKTVYSRCLQKLVKALNKQEWKLKETHLLRMLTAAIQQSSNFYIIFILLGIIFWSSPLV